MGKPTVPTAADAAQKWADVTPTRSSYYEKNTPGAASKWESASKAAAANYKVAVQASNIGQMFSGGIAKAGGAKFARKVTALAGRFGPGVAAAQTDMANNIAPMLQVISQTEIGDRKPRGDPANYGRVQKIGDALHTKRLAQAAAGPA
jgi:hypothetical protein